MLFGVCGVALLSPIPLWGRVLLCSLAKRLVCPIAKRSDPYKLARKLDDLAREMNLPDAERVINFGYQWHH